MMSPELSYYLELEAKLKAHQAKHPELEEDSELEESHLLDRMAAAWYALSQDERDELNRQQREFLDAQEQP